MTIAYDTQHQLDHLFVSGGLDLAVRNAIINYLKEDGLGANSKVWVQEGGAGGLNPLTQVLYLDGSHEQVQTDANLKAIVDVGDGRLDVSGNDNVLVAADQDVNLIDLRGTTGNDEVVIGGNGSNNDAFWDDDRHYSTLTGGGDDLWRSGDGNQGGFDQGGGDERGQGHGNQGYGNNDFWGDDKNYSTLAGGDGGGAGDNWNSGDGDHGNGGTVTIIAGSGNDTIVGGKENDLIELGRQGNDVIYGGGGDNTVQFDDSLANATISSKAGVTTVQFSDTHQTITLTNIQTLEFTDPHHGKG